MPWMMWLKRIGGTWNALCVTLTRFSIPMIPNTQARYSGIMVHSLCHSTPTFSLLNAENPTRVQEMMRHQHYATAEIYVEQAQRSFEGMEDAVTRI